MAAEERTDIVITSLSELVIFLLFFFLILLGSIVAFGGIGRAGDEVITIIDNGEYETFFGSGKHAVGADFEKALETTHIPEIRKLVESGGFENPVIEVVGHTDETILTSSNCTNIDWTLPQLLQRAEAPGKEFEGRCKSAKRAPTVGDNAGLGLARAAAVAHFLRVSDNFPTATFVVLSGAQLNKDANALDDDQTWYQEDETRRRIEIRVREAFVLRVKEPRK